MNESTSSPVIWINAGETSGDMHGALLVRALRARAPGVRCTGLGGEAMVAEGFHKEFDVSELSLVGITEVVAHLPRVVGLMRRIRRRLKALRPAAVVCIDAPDFNFFVVRMARRLGIPVYYYICPQVWAWRTGRVRFLRDNVERVLCILPFETPFLAAHGLEADYVGHPLTDQIPLDELRAVPPVRGRVGILPGSRGKEIATLLPEFADAARRIRERLPGAEFVLARAPGMSEERLREHLPPELPVTVVEPRERYEAMRRCECVLAASGTVTLELALLGVPTVVAYRVSPLSYAIGKRVVKVDFISLPNLILGEAAFPELIQKEARGETIAAHALKWLESEAAMRTVRSRLERLADMVGEPGAPGRAADIILHGIGLGAAGGAD